MGCFQHSTQTGSTIHRDYGRTGVPRSCPTLSSCLLPHLFWGLTRLIFQSASSDTFCKSRGVSAHGKTISAGNGEGELEVGRACLRHVVSFPLPVPPGVTYPFLRLGLRPHRCVANVHSHLFIGTKLRHRSLLKHQISIYVGLVDINT